MDETIKQTRFEIYDEIRRKLEKNPHLFSDGRLHEYFNEEMTPMHRTPQEYIVNRKIYKESIIKWGVWAQLDQSVEECTELNLAVCKLKRNIGKTMTERIIDVIDEIADVRIITEELQECIKWHPFGGIYDDKIIDQMIENRIIYKFERLKERLRNTDKKRTPEIGK